MFIVTGASAGIGRATAVALAARGTDVLGVARSHDALDELRAIAPDHITTLTADLGTPDGVDALVAAVEHPVDGIVHCAGSAIPLGDYADLDPQELLDDLQIHVVAPIAINNGLGERLRDARIAYIDSFSATDPRVGWAAYSIAKSAAQMAARLAGEELDECLVIRIFPGGVRTRLVEPILDATTASPTTAAFTALDEAGDLAEPDAVASFIVGILLDATREELAQRDTWHYTDPF